MGLWRATAFLWCAARRGTHGCKSRRLTCSCRQGDNVGGDFQSGSGDICKSCDKACDSTGSNAGCDVATCATTCDNSCDKACNKHAPLEVIEIGHGEARVGQVYPVKPLLAFLVVSPDLKSSWKIVAVDSSDPMAATLQDSRSGYPVWLEAKLREIVEWLKYYKCNTVCKCSLLSARAREQTASAALTNAISEFARVPFAQPASVPAAVADGAAVAEPVGQQARKQRRPRDARDEAADGSNTSSGLTVGGGGGGERSGSTRGVLKAVLKLFGKSRGKDKREALSDLPYSSNNHHHEEVYTDFTVPLSGNADSSTDVMSRFKRALSDKTERSLPRSEDNLHSSSSPSLPGGTTDVLSRFKRALSDSAERPGHDSRNHDPHAAASSYAAPFERSARTAPPPPHADAYGKSPQKSPQNVQQASSPGAQSCRLEAGSTSALMRRQRAKAAAALESAERCKQPPAVSATDDSGAAAAAAAAAAGSGSAAVGEQLLLQQQGLEQQQEEVGQEPLLQLKLPLKLQTRLKQASQGQKLRQAAEGQGLKDRLQQGLQQGAEGEEVWHGGYEAVRASAAAQLAPLICLTPPCPSPVDSSPSPVDASHSPTNASPSPINASRLPVEASPSPVTTSFWPLGSKKAEEEGCAQIHHTAAARDNLAREENTVSWIDLSYNFSTHPGDSQHSEIVRSYIEELVAGCSDGTEDGGGGCAYNEALAECVYGDDPSLNAPRESTLSMEEGSMGIGCSRRAHRSSSVDRSMGSGYGRRTDRSSSVERSIQDIGGHSISPETQIGRRLRHRRSASVACEGTFERALEPTFVPTLRRRDSMGSVGSVGSASLVCERILSVCDVSPVPIILSSHLGIVGRTRHRSASAERLDVYSAGSGDAYSTAAGAEGEVAAEAWSGTSVAVTDYSSVVAGAAAAAAAGGAAGAAAGGAAGAAAGGAAGAAAAGAAGAAAAGAGRTTTTAAPQLPRRPAAPRLGASRRFYRTSSCPDVENMPSPAVPQAIPAAAAAAEEVAEGAAAAIEVAVAGEEAAARETEAAEEGEGGEEGQESLESRLRRWHESMGASSAFSLPHDSTPTRGLFLPGLPHWTKRSLPRSLRISRSLLSFQERALLEHRQETALLQGMTGKEKWENDGEDELWSERNEESNEGIHDASKEVRNKRRARRCERATSDGVYSASREFWRPPSTPKPVKQAKVCLPRYSPPVPPIGLEKLMEGAAGGGGTGAGGTGGFAGFGLFGGGGGGWGLGTGWWGAGEGAEGGKEGKEQMGEAGWAGIEGLADAAWGMVWGGGGGGGGEGAKEEEQGGLGEGVEVVTGEKVEGGDAVTGKENGITEGEEENMGGGGGAAGGYPNVWALTGGWYCDPKHWRRNTAFALAGIFAVCVPIALTSARLEQRPIAPSRAIPSQMWCSNFPAESNQAAEE
ncbi:unnamed protein product [Closterium sp. Yama58-4]|nr:unnamed protein product [Closterium sp. Yama58-4]